MPPFYLIRFAIRLAAKKEARQADDGALVLHHGILTLLIWWFFVFGVLVFVIGLLLNPPSFINSTGVVMIMIVLSWGIFMAVTTLAIGIREKVTIMGDEISIKHVWNTKTSRIKASEIKKVSGSEDAGSFIIQFENLKKVQVSSYLYGIKILTDWFQRNIEPEKYSSAVKLISYIQQNS
jgi:hypothetical protein